jgi:hypothetical protein
VRLQRSRDRQGGSWNRGSVAPGQGSVLGSAEDLLEHLDGSENSAQAGLADLGLTPPSRSCVIQIGVSAV